MGLKVLKSYAGMRIGKVTVLRRAPQAPIRVLASGQEVREPPAWICRCDCGHTWSVAHRAITATGPMSCFGCRDTTPNKHVRLPRSKAHIKKQHPSYGSWYAMIRRCTSPSHQNYHRYGGRGITVDPAWMDFDQFVADMGVRPLGHTIERIDNDKGYTKSNCTWATPKQQRANQRKSNRTNR